MEKFALICLGIMLGIGLTNLLYNLFFKMKPSGVLKVAMDNEDGPYLFLELNEQVYEVCKKKKVLFYVDINRPRK